MIDRNHPAVEAGAEGMEYPHIPTAHDAITAALPHLESATEENVARLRDTPAGRALRAEGWDEGSAMGSAFRRSTADTFPSNPYKETPDE